MASCKINCRTKKKQGTKPAILTLVERKSRKSCYILIKNKTQSEVLRAL